MSKSSTTDSAAYNTKTKITIGTPNKVKNCDRDQIRSEETNDTLSVSDFGKRDESRLASQRTWSTSWSALRRPRAEWNISRIRLPWRNQPASCQLPPSCYLLWFYPSQLPPLLYRLGGIKIGVCYQEEADQNRGSGVKTRDSTYRFPPWLTNKTEKHGWV